MNINENIIEFGDYVTETNYLDDRMNINKYYHSIRVCEYATNIAKSLNLSEKDTYIASLCGLLHDISRFTQWNLFHTYNDVDSFDHGDESYNILKKDDYICAYTLDSEIQDIVLTASKYHNKYEVPNNLDKRVRMFCDIVRDADKLDILAMQRCETSGTINDKILASAKKKELCKNDDIISRVDSITRNLCLVFDLKFKSSLEIIQKQNILEDLINNIKEHCENKSVIEEIEKVVNKYIKEVELC